MKNAVEEDLRRLAGIWKDSSSEEEFRLRAAAEGGFRLRARLLFRAWLLRRRRRELAEWLELLSVGLGVGGFALWCGVAGPKNGWAAAWIVPLSCVAMSAWTLLVLRFDELCRAASAAAGEEAP